MTKTLVTKTSLFMVTHAMFFITPTIWPNGERIHGSLYTGASLGSETLDTNISIENVLLW